MTYSPTTLTTMVTKVNWYWLAPVLRKRRKIMDQTSPANDRKLHSLSATIGFARLLSERATLMHDEAWEKVRAIFNEFPKLGKRFLADDGYYMQDQRKEGTSKLNPDELYERMHSHFETPEEFKRRWNAITVQPPRVIDYAKLEIEVRKGHIPTELYQSCIHTPEATYSRIRQTWTKEDVNRAVVYGIQVQDPEVIREQQIKLLEEIIAELKGTDQVPQNI